MAALDGQTLWAMTFIIIITDERCIILVSKNIYTKSFVGLENEVCTIKDFRGDS